MGAQISKSFMKSFNKKTDTKMNPDKFTEVKETENVQSKPTPQDNRLTILTDSKVRIETVKSYGDYFNHSVIHKCVDQLNLLHNLFESNSLINILKLEQLHYTRTDHFNNLLEKSVKNREENIKLLSQQLEMVDSQIKKSENYLTDLKILQNKRKSYVESFELILLNIYRVLCEKSNDNIYQHNQIKLDQTDLYFNTKDNNKVYMENYLVLDHELDFIRTSDNYTVQSLSMNKELLGLLNLNRFSIEHIEGIIYNDNILELFKLKRTGQYFIFNTNTLSFNLIDFNLIADLLEKHHYVRDNKKDLLQEKKMNLTQKMTILKTITDEQTNSLIDKFYDKIMQESFEVDNSQLELESRFLNKLLDKVNKLNI